MGGTSQAFQEPEPHLKTRKQKPRGIHFGKKWRGARQPKNFNLGHREQSSVGENGTSEHPHLSAHHTDVFTELPCLGGRGDRGPAKPTPWGPRKEDHKCKACLGYRAPLIQIWTI